MGTLIEAWKILSDCKNKSLIQVKTKSNQFLVLKNTMNETELGKNDENIVEEPIENMRKVDDETNNLKKNYQTIKTEIRDIQKSLKKGNILINKLIF